MEYRTRLGAAVSATIGLFLLVQLGALALVDPYVAADAQPVEDPGDPGNVLFFFGIILAATAVMLAAIKFDLERLIRGFVVLTCGYISWIVVSTVLSPLGSTAGDSTAGTALAWTSFLAPVLLGLAVIAALAIHPEWYVIDAAGVLLGAGAAGLFGLAFTPQLTVVFLVILAVYDAISVYGTEHMLELAEGVSDLHIPVMLVIPAVRGYSLLEDDGPSTLDDHVSSTAASDPTAGGDATNPGGTTDAAELADASDAAHASDADHESGTSDVFDTSDASDASDASNVADDVHDAQTEDPADEPRDALYIGLGDAVMPTILVASSAAFMRDAAPLYDVPLLAINSPAAGALVGTLVGLTVLLWLVLKGRAHAGLPLLNGGAIAGYLLGAVASGITVAEALGLPL